MKDKKDFYECDADSSKQTLTLHDGADTTHWPVLHYAYPSGGQMQLSGKWKGREIKVSLQAVPIDILPMNEMRRNDDDALGTDWSQTSDIQRKCYLRWLNHA